MNRDHVEREGFEHGLGGVKKTAVCWTVKMTGTPPISFANNSGLKTR
jgi:hypothetical protein